MDCFSVIFSKRYSHYMFSFHGIYIFFLRVFLARQFPICSCGCSLHIYICVCMGYLKSSLLYYLYSSLIYSKKLTWFCCFFLAYFSFYTFYNLLFHPCLNCFRNQFLLKRSASQVGNSMWFQSVATDYAKPTAGRNRAATGIKYLCIPPLHQKKERKKEK